MSLSLPADFLVRIFADSPFDLPLALDHAVRETLPGTSIVMTQSLDVAEYQRLGLCSRRLLSEPQPLVARYWGGEDRDRLFDDWQKAVWEVTWQEQTLHVLYVQWETSCGPVSRTWVLADDEETVDAFILDVARKTNDPGAALLVFRGGHWDRSQELFRTVQQSSFDDLILDESLKSSIREDFARFLNSEEEYTRLGLSWRRGALLIGPPGNGKTHCVRALVKELGIPALYVQSLKHRYFEGEQLLQMVFDRARELRPSVLIMEDLDSLVNADNQSFFFESVGWVRKEPWFDSAGDDEPSRPN